MKKIDYFLSASLILLIIVLLLPKSDESTDFSEPVQVKEQVKSKENKEEASFETVSYLRPPAELKSDIQKIIGLEKSSLSERSEILWKIQENKVRDPKVHQALFYYLNTPREFDELGLKNDTIEYLIRNADLQSYGQLMQELLTDQSRHRVLREYLLQYVPEYTAKRWPDKAVVEPELELLVKTLWDLSQEQEGAVAGTALFALRNLAAERDLVAMDKVLERASSVARDMGVDDASRMAAVQTISLEGDLRYKDVVKELLEAKEGSILLQLCTMNAASQYMDADIRRNLQDISLDRELDKRLRLGAKKILSQL